MTALRTRRLLLRPMKTTDCDDLFAVFSHPDAMRYWSTLPHATPDVTGEMIAGIIGADPSRHLEMAIEFDGRVIGKIGLWTLPELGYVLRPD